MAYYTTGIPPTTRLQHLPPSPPSLVPPLLYGLVVADLRRRNTVIVREEVAGKEWVFG